MQAFPYLTFNGNCRKAMLFYKDCIGGRLQFQELASALSVQPMPVKMKDCIVQATLTKGNLVLMGTDMVPEEGLAKGNAVAIMLHCHNEATLRKCYQKLATGGRNKQPPAYTQQGALFGGLTDKYGHQWLLHAQNKKPKQ